MTREEAIKELELIAKVTMWNNRREAVEMAIESLSADEVVRCKDCKHYESDGGALMVCSDTGVVVDDTDYCSYGERREP